MLLGDDLRVIAFSEELSETRRTDLRSEFYPKETTMQKDVSEV